MKTEKEIEDYLFQNPDAITDYPVDFWLARQFKVPSGIIDLLGGNIENYSDRLLLSIWVVEVKNVPIKKQHLTQVFRYANDIANIFDYFRGDLKNDIRPGIEKIIITPFSTNDRQLLIEAEAMNIRVLQIDLEDETGTNEIWIDEMNQKGQMYKEIAQGEVFTELKMLLLAHSAIERNRIHGK